MYIIAIAWLYVTVIMGASESNITAGILTFAFYGLIPCSIFIWLMGTPQRRRNQSKKEASALKPELSNEYAKDTKQD